MMKCRIFTLILLSIASVAYSQVLPAPIPPFQGKIGATLQDSTPAYPPFRKAPQGAPNVIVILLDDTGYGFADLFGGKVAMPTLNQLASSGLRYNRFHTTGLCSPSRASLLTGRNHHDLGTATTPESGVAGFPGRNSIWPKSAASIAEILRQNGFSTAAFGKWHNTPLWETSMVGPFDHWPTGQGFEYFYGFNVGEINQWSPVLVENTSRIEVPTSKGEYHLTTDITDKAISWLNAQHSIAPQRPFFIYYATGATHAPHQAPKSWIAKYKGVFDKGWDAYRTETFLRQKRLGVIPENTKLTPRPKEIPAWDSLSKDEQKVYARMMEVYAGFLAHTDFEIGRLMGAVERLGEKDNTLVFYIVGDNGGSTEGGLHGTVNEIKGLAGIQDDLKNTLSKLDELGGPDTYENYPAGWAWAGSTPFQWTKAVASHFGGTRNPLIVSWPRGITDKGTLRTQFHHIIDITPTILDAVGVATPTQVNGVAQQRMDGISMTYTFSKSGEAAPGQRHIQYFDVIGNKGIYQDGWFASNIQKIPWKTASGAAWDIDKSKWALYNLDEDFSQAVDLSEKYPEKLAQMKHLWHDEAARNNVFPAWGDAKGVSYPPDVPGLPSGDTSHYTYSSPITLPYSLAPPTLNRAHSITADIDISTDSEGVIVAEGGRFGGYSLFINKGKLFYVYNWFNEQRYTISSNGLKPGRNTIRYDFTCTEKLSCTSGTGELFINNDLAGKVEIAKTMKLFYLGETFDVGQDLGTPVSDIYKAPYPFTGDIERVQVSLN